MIIRIKKRDLIGSLTFIFYAAAIILTLSAISLPIVFPVTINTTKLGFKVELVISNRNPAINVSNTTGFSVDPVSASSVAVLISFNVTDADGASNINASSAVLNFTLAGSSQYYSNVSAIASSEFGTCKNHSESSTVVVINCSVLLPYFVNASSAWVVNVSVKDLSGGIGRNDTLRFTVNSLSSLSLPIAAVNFSNVNVGQQDVPSSSLILNNTGNDDFDQINITATALVGTTITTESIAATNFYANISNATAGLGLQLGTSAVSLVELQGTGTNATLIHGHTSAFAPNADKGNKTVFFWVDVPSGGLSSQLFNATWNVTVINNP